MLISLNRQKILGSRDDVLREAIDWIYRESIHGYRVFLVLLGLLIAFTVTTILCLVYTPRLVLPMTSITLIILAAIVAQYMFSGIKSLKHFVYPIYIKRYRDRYLVADLGKNVKPISITLYSVTMIKTLESTVDEVHTNAIQLSELHSHKISKSIGSSGTPFSDIEVKLFDSIQRAVDIVDNVIGSRYTVDLYLFKPRKGIDRAVIDSISDNEKIDVIEFNNVDTVVNSLNDVVEKIIGIDLNRLYSFNELIDTSYTHYKEFLDLILRNIREYFNNIKSSSRDLEVILCPQCLYREGIYGVSKMNVYGDRAICPKCGFSIDIENIDIFKTAALSIEIEKSWIEYVLDILKESSSLFQDIVKRREVLVSNYLSLLASTYTELLNGLLSIELRVADLESRSKSGLAIASKFAKILKLKHDIIKKWKRASSQHTKQIHEVLDSLRDELDRYWHSTLRIFEIYSDRLLPLDTLPIPLIDRYIEVLKIFKELDLVDLVKDMRSRNFIQSRIVERILRGV